jgi:hypothetical protein
LPIPTLDQEIPLTAFRHRLAACCAICAAVLAWGSSAHASAQVNRFSLVLSANPTTVDAKDFNEQVIDRVNHSVLDPRGLEGVEKITFAWLYDAQLRYFIRPNFAVETGVGQLRTISKREFQPAINQSIDYSAEMLSVHVGGAYYLPAYNQGDFQARMYLGGGFMSVVYNRARFSAVESHTDSAHTLGGDYRFSFHRDSPGYYLDVGVHMFFGGRYSVLLGGVFRSAVVRRADGLLEIPLSTGLVRIPLGPSIDIDTSGAGAKMAIAIGL